RSRRPRTATLLPYTTLFRSHRGGRGHQRVATPRTIRRVADYRSAHGAQDRRRPSRSDGETGALHRGGSTRGEADAAAVAPAPLADRKSTRLNSSHEWISYAV